MIDERAIATLRALFLEAVEDAGAHLPICYSGGVDSSTVLAASLALGARPSLYTFRLGERDSPDVAVARAVAARFDLSLSVATIPRREDVLVDDVRRIIAILGRTTKTHVQCAQPFLYLAERITADQGTPAAALMGMAAGDYWGTTRKDAMGYARHGEAWIKAQRRRHIADPNVSDWSVVKVAASAGLELRDPWRYQALGEFLFEIDHADLHAGYQKSIAVRAFPEFWRAGAFYRRNASLQLVSGLREWHDTLLASPVNVRRSKSVVGVYNSLAREVAS